MKEKALLIAVFGAFGILSNYTGIEISEHSISADVWQTEVGYGNALTNTRVLGVALGGLLGGPIAGWSAGLIAGLHRLTLGGFTAIACGISTIAAGAVTGFIGQRFRLNSKHSVWQAALIGIIMESVQMGIILAVAKQIKAVT